MKKYLIYALPLIAALVGVAFFFCAHTLLLVTTGSMSPGIPQGSVVVVKKGHMPSAGDVITYEFKNGSYITHRVISTDSIGKDRIYHTKGDANKHPDPSPIGRQDILGRVVFSIPYLGHLLAFMTSSLFLLFGFYIPAGYAFGKLLNRFVNHLGN
jgi:signal peptidase I